MEYKLLSNHTGIILTRHPEQIADELRVTFTGAPKGATAIFESVDGESAYRELSEGSCSVPAALVVGEVKVAVAMFGGNTQAERWICEEIKGEVREGKVVVLPNDMNLPLVVASLRLEMDALRVSAKEMLDRCAALEEKWDSFMSGYDIT